MILRDTSNRTQEGNLQGETIKMGISDIRLIIDRLTDLYSDRELACIREYSTNAVDAHVEAGITTPIEVTTPGPLSPFLTIKDFGVGLDVEDIRVIYSQYGASTKRNSNAQTGALGLGCKSALSYTDQFTVTSVKDGVRIQVVVSRDPKEGATMKVVDTSDTSEPNGTTVMIPARGYNQFEAKAKDFFKYWKPGTVVLNGSQPEQLPGAKWVSDDIAIMESGGSNANRIVMGGVPYPAPGIRSGLGYYQSIVAYVPIGAVDFAPSREALMDTDETNATLRKVEAEFKAKLSASIVKDIQEADSPAEAIRRRLAWLRKLPAAMMPASTTFKGAAIPSGQGFPEGTIYAAEYARKMSQHEILKRQLPFDAALNALYVHGFDYASFTATVRKKLEKYCEDNDINSTGGYVLLKGDMSTVDKTWLTDIATVDWPTVKALKLPRAARTTTASGRIPGSYDIFENGDWNEGVPGDDIDTSHSIFWMLGTRWNEGKDIAAWLKDSYPKGCTLVMLRAGREDKFQRNFPQATNVQDVLKAAFKNWTDKLNKDDVTALAIRESLDRRFSRLPIDRLNDPEIKRVAGIVERDTSVLEAQIKTWARLGFHYAGAYSDELNPLAKYVLLPDSYYWRNVDIEAIVRYMNCEYAFQAAQGSK
jgi:hypothetical protein